MKRLYLLRSARHRAADHSGLTDYHRPLTRRGEIGAIAVGKTMHKNGYVPDLVICATATRTRQTLANMWPYIQGNNGNAPKIIYDNRIHLMRGEAMLQRLRETEPQFERVLLISISPGISDLARLLNRPDMTVPDAFAQDIPFGGLAAFDCNVESWALLTPACGALVNFLN